MNYTKTLHCGCIIIIKDWKGDVQMCSKHKSAPDLYEALKATIGRVNHSQKCNIHHFDRMTNLAIKVMEDCGYNNDCDCGLKNVLEQRDKALAKAEGKDG